MNLNLPFHDNYINNLEFLHILLILFSLYFSFILFNKETENNSQDENKKDETQEKSTKKKRSFISKKDHSRAERARKLREELIRKEEERKKEEEERKLKGEDEEYEELTQEQIDELWAETYYTKPKQEEKEVEVLSKKKKLLITIFIWFVFFNMLTAFITHLSSIDPNTINYVVTTKPYCETQEYADNVIEILNIDLETLDMSVEGERFLEYCKNMINADTFTTYDLQEFLKMWDVKELDTHCRYKILYCLLQYFIDFYKESAILDRGHIRYIVKLCHAYCIEANLIYNQFDLIRLIRFIYYYLEEQKKS